MHTYNMCIPICVHCGMFGSNFSHESGRNVDNYFHFRTVGYFRVQQNQKLVMVLYSDMCMNYSQES